jgi:protein phosphatase
LDRSWGYGSDRGLRKDNDDTFGVFQFTDYTLAVVCDGVGGIRGARHASQLAVRTIHDTLTGPTPSSVEESLREAINRSNHVIFDESRRNHRLAGMGTTIVVTAILDDEAYIAHVGDSRAYLVREGSVQQLTKDHTMVNLFVETGLLSADEAQTHPEAHVLSRTVGVERTVEIDVEGPVKLQENDVLLLCSDGVHAILTDWELGNIDWDTPQQAIQQVMEMVHEREGGDNATLIAVTMAQCDENVGLTAPPDMIPEAAETLTPADSVALGQTPAPAPMPSAAPQAAPWQYTDQEEVKDGASAEIVDTIPSPAPVPPPPPSVTAPSATEQIPAPPSLNDILGQGVAGVSSAGAVIAPPPAPGAPPPPPAPTMAPPAEGLPSLRKAPKREFNLRAFGPAIGVGLAMALLVLAVVIKYGGSGNQTEQPAISAEGTPAPKAAPVEIETTARLSLSNPRDPAPAAAPTGPDTLSFFAPYVPPPPKRLHHQPSIYLQPSPGGPHQWQAVQAARNKRCAGALEATVKAMADSTDHASLYAQVWFCFNEYHQKPLLNAKIDSVAEFVTLIPDLQGEEQPSGELPSWYIPSNGGIERRLEMWRSSNQSDLFRPVIEDLLGAPNVADDLAADLLIEAQAAVMLSRSARMTGIHFENQEEHQRLINWWARRVYVLSAALNGPVGQSIRVHRPELLPQLQNQLDEAAWRPQSPNEPVAIMPPQAVSEAFAVGIGAMAGPSPVAPKEGDKPVIRRKPKPKPEPEITAPFIIHRLEKTPRPLPGAPG